MSTGRGKGLLGRWMRRRPVVPVLRLSGMIGQMPLRGGGLSLAALEAPIERAFAAKRAPAVALAINSPGGSPVQSALIAGRIKELARRKDKKVIAFVEDIAASGGFWLALAADEIIADSCSIVGSIGVVTSGFGFTEAIGRLGIERRLHVTGARKSLLDPFKPEDPGDLAVLKEIQGDIFEAFKSEVRSRRGDRLKLGEDELFDGRIWSGTTAQSHGLIDGIGEMASTLRERFGEEVRTRVVNAPRGFLMRRFRFEEEAAMLLGVFEDRLARARYGL